MRNSRPLGTVSLGGGPGWLNMDIKHHLMERMLASGSSNISGLGSASEWTEDNGEQPTQSQTIAGETDKQWTDSGIRVLFRLRPLGSGEIGLGSTMLYNHHCVRVTRSKKVHEFKYHGIIGPGSSQKDAVTRCTSGVVDHLLSGYNSAILTYGQTGSGKSHTLIGVQHASSLCRLLDKMETLVESAAVFPSGAWHATASTQTEPGQIHSCITLYIITTVKVLHKRLPDLHAAYKLSTSFVTPQQAAVLYGVILFMRSSITKNSFLHSCLVHISDCRLQLLEMFLKVISGNRFIPYDDERCESDYGILPSVALRIFERIDPSATRVHFSAVQLYNEEVTDLLHDDEGKTPKKQRLLTDPEKGVWLPDATEIVCPSAGHLLSHAGIAVTKRTVGSTHSNFVSSRSHAIFIITLHTTSPRFSNVSQLYCVDLAGSERADTSLASRKEGSHINRSLLALRKMIAAVGNVDRTTENVSRSDVVSRESKLTRLLQNCIGGNSRTAIVVTGSYSAAHASETFSSLSFGSLATKVVNTSKTIVTHNIKDLLKVVNQQANELALLRSENTELKQRIHQLDPLFIDDTITFPIINSMGSNPLQVIFSFLPINDFVTVGFVCSLWLSLTDEDDVWIRRNISRKAYVERCYEPPVTPPPEKEVSPRYMCHYSPPIPTGLRLAAP
eukprot:TRINITY_DN4590_c0_g1_i1.p1 TRINITY_DN4590_c0_g1~~TRINITY_DN4590_c0_g1_i1.p1  ORF type:complete len:672 (+),score=82.71 TRINITY_DN4590_c0_g1_i1:89-2104(+)